MRASTSAPKGLAGSLRRLRAANRRGPASEAGDTLIEVVLAVVVIALTAAALLGAITESIVSSSAHRNLTTDDTLLRSYAEAVQYQVEDEQQPNPPYPLYQTCATSYSPTFSIPSVDSGYQLAVTKIQYWGNGTYLTSALTQGMPYSSLSVNPLVYQVSPGDVLIIGIQTVYVWGTQVIMPGATSIPISTTPPPNPQTPFTPSGNYLAGPPNPSGTNTTWLYDQGWFPAGACSNSELAQGALPGNDFQRLTLTVTAPTGISEQMDIIVRNPNYV